MQKRRWIAHSDELRLDSPIDVDSVMEFHAGRLLLVFRYCGSGANCEVSGRTKLAKLDFFVRYPQFLARALDRLRESGTTVPVLQLGDDDVEASMIKYRYGPWDHGYYDVIGFLMSRGLLSVDTRAHDNYRLTHSGVQLADQLARNREFGRIVDRCIIVKGVFGAYSGNRLRDLIYQSFPEDIVDAAWNAVIPSQPRQGGE